MLYEEEISRRNPSCFVFLIDQSASMAEKFGGTVEGAQNSSKAEAATDALNRCLYNLILRCSKDAEVWNYFYITVWGYGETVGPALSGQLSGRQLYLISEFEDAPLRVEDRTRKTPDGAGGLVEQNFKFPVWVDPVAKNGTPMCQALKEVKEIIAPWMTEHPESYPPTIINITDGMSNDGDPRSIAKEFSALANSNGSTLLMFNIHISELALQPMRYPSNIDKLFNDEYAKTLFEMSSILPEKLVAEASASDLPVSAGSRGFVFNGQLVDLIQFMDIGTRTPTMTSAEIYSKED